MSGGRATPATTLLERRGVAFEVLAYEHDPAVASYGAEAAARLALDPDRVLKTLLAEVDGAVTVAVVPVSGSLDLKALARVRGGRRAALADPGTAERVTGYVVGGISPIGQRRPCPVVVDESALLWDTVYVSGGRRGLDLGLAPADLVAVTDAQVADIAR